MLKKCEICDKLTENIAKKFTQIYNILFRYKYTFNGCSVDDMKWWLIKSKKKCSKKPAPQMRLPMIYNVYHRNALYVGCYIA